MNFLKFMFTSFIISMLILLSCTDEIEKEKEIPSHIEPITTIGDLDLSTGQVVYVPAYSQIYSIYAGNENAVINCGVTLSIRNTDFKNPIIIKSVSYYNNDGTLLNEQIESAFQLAPMASFALNIKPTIDGGGIGANFIVKWGAKQSVYEPYIEAIMIGAAGTHAFAWRSPGHIIKEVTN